MFKLTLASASTGCQRAGLAGWRPTAQPRRRARLARFARGWLVSLILNLAQLSLPAHTAPQPGLPVLRQNPVAPAQGSQIRARRPGAPAGLWARAGTDPQARSVT